MKDIVIIGSGGFAKEVKFLIDQINNNNKLYKFKGYIDFDVTKDNVIGDDNYLIRQNKLIAVALGIGNPKMSKNIIELYKNNHNIEFPNLIHPNIVADWKNIQMGVGNIFCAGNILTTQIKIGSHNIFNLNCTVGHDVTIGDFNVINPGVNISGGVKVGKNNLIGTNATLLQCTNISDNNVIGANTLINKDCIETGTYVGVPGKKIR